MESFFDEKVMALMGSVEEEGDDESKRRKLGRRAGSWGPGGGAARSSQEQRIPPDVLKILKCRVTASNFPDNSTTDYREGVISNFIGGLARGERWGNIKVTAPKKKGDCVYIDFTSEEMARQFHQDSFQHFKELTIEGVNGVSDRPVFFNLRKSDDENKRSHATRLFAAKLSKIAFFEGIDVVGDKHSGYVKVKNFRVFSVTVRDDVVNGGPIKRNCVDACIPDVEKTLREQWELFRVDFH